MSFGFIGVGRMGGGLARNLIRAGQEVLLYDLSSEAVQKTIEAGTTGKACKELKDMAGAAVVFTSLPLPTDVEGVMLGKAGFGLYRPKHN
jgi:3-hydroxyisobutyrate dehydrogenase-like beta-hydroxyacid dehydrogenase